MRNDMEVIVHSLVELLPMTKEKPVQMKKAAA